MSYRKLLPLEIKKLKANNCHAADWGRIKVQGKLKPDRFHRVTFCGDIQLGHLDGDIETMYGVRKPCGLYNVYLQDCTVGNQVYIADVNTLANYDIADNVAIENVATLVVEGETAFANGLAIDCLNEGGGRELYIHDSLSSAMAYLNVFYRHDERMIEGFRKLAAAQQKARTAARGRIESGARICNTAVIRNVYIGPSTVISGAARLDEGTIAGCTADPAYVGDGVIAEHFIILSGSRVESGAMLSKCFVGQSVRMGKQFSAENSCLFTNSEAFHSEAVSLFAGPYTVTHHRSTLLIAGLLSFYNAGSGTNASNHMYRLGPLHQGILERGAKTGSFSYLLWPARVGPFSVVIGKHYVNFDAGEFPFSYINEVEGRTILTPAMNLFTVGTRRDSVKWPARDRRKDPHKLDLIHFDLFNPYTIGKLIKGLDVLKKLAEAGLPTQELVSYNGLHIKRLLLKTTAKYYEIALKIYIGQEWLKQLRRQQSCCSWSQLLIKLDDQRTTGYGDWVDMAGLLAPKQVVDSLLQNLRQERFASWSALQTELEKIHRDYETFSWQWCIELMRKRMEFDFAQCTREQTIRFIQEWLDNQTKLNNMILRDAEKEFDNSSRIGFGIDGDVTIRDADFFAVRGQYASNKFVEEIVKESQTARQTAADWQNWIINLCD